MLTSAKVDPRAGTADIDRDVRRLVEQGLSVYRIDTDALERVQPDLVVTQDQCQVCAVSLDDVTTAVRRLSRREVRVVSLSPLSLSDVMRDILGVAEALGVEPRGAALVEILRARLDRVRQAASGPRPRLVHIEWIDPLMVGGHWIHELAEAAGGVHGLGVRDAKTEAASWEALRAYDPEVVVIAPCGFTVPQSVRDLGLLSRRPGWPELSAVRSGRVFVADGNAFFNRPGPRLVETAEIFQAALSGRRDFHSFPADALAGDSVAGAAHQRQGGAFGEEPTRGVVELGEGEALGGAGFFLGEGSRGRQSTFPAAGGLALEVGLRLREVRRGESAARDVLQDLPDAAEDLAGVLGRGRGADGEPAVLEAWRSRCRRGRAPRVPSRAGPRNRSRRAGRGALPSPPGREDGERSPGHTTSSSFCAAPATPRAARSIVPVPGRARTERRVSAHLPLAGPEPLSARPRAAHPRPPPVSAAPAPSRRNRPSSSRLMRSTASGEPQGGRDVGESGGKSSRRARARSEVASVPSLSSARWRAAVRRRFQPSSSGNGACRRPASTRKRPGTSSGSPAAVTSIACPLTGASGSASSTQPSAGTVVSSSALGWERCSTAKPGPLSTGPVSRPSANRDEGCPADRGDGEGNATRKIERTRRR